MPAAPTAEAPNSLSNELPLVTRAVLMHRVFKARAEAQRAMAALRLAERQAVGAGVSLRAMRTIMEMVKRGPAWVEAQQRELFVNSAAIGFGVLVEAPVVNDVISDQSPDDRRGDIRREGYHAAVCGDARLPEDKTSDDRAAWLEGYDAFAADMAAFEQSETQKRARGVRTPAAA